MPASSTWQLRRTTHISKAQQQRPFVTGCLSVQRHRDDDNDDVGSNADQALSKHKVLLLNKGPRIGKRQGGITKHCVARSFFAPARAAKRGGPRFFLFVFFPRAESLSRRSQGEHPRHKTARGRSGWGVRESTPNGTSEQPLRNASLGTRKASQRARSSSSTMATLLFFSPVHTGCFLRERPIFTLPHSHSLVHFKPTQNPCRVRDTPPEYIPNQTRVAVSTMSQAYETRSSHTHTHAQGLGMTPLEVALRISTPRY